MGVPGDGAGLADRASRGAHMWFWQALSTEVPWPQAWRSKGPGTAAGGAPARLWEARLRNRITGGGESRPGQRLRACQDQEVPLSPLTPWALLQPWKGL